jgi:hypothetical protein
MGLTTLRSIKLSQNPSTAVFEVGDFFIRGYYRLQQLSENENLIDELL